MSKVMLVNDKSFDTEVTNSDKIVLVDFSAAWCGPCKSLMPVLEQFANEADESVKVVKVDIDDSPTCTSKFGVRSVPTLIAMKNGKEISRQVGMASKKRLAEMVTDTSK